MSSFDAYKDFLLPMIVICLVSTLVVMAVTGRVSQAVMRRSQPHSTDREAQS